MSKLLLWLPAIVAPLLGILEAVLKFLKEVLTLVVTVLFPIIPNEGFKKIVTTVRGIVDKVYDLLSQWKEKILSAIKLI
jgi:hypothetical protein